MSHADDVDRHAIDTNVFNHTQTLENEIAGNLTGLFSIKSRDIICAILLAV